MPVLCFYVGQREEKNAPGLARARRYELQLEGGGSRLLRVSAVTRAQLRAPLPPSRAIVIINSAIPRQPVDSLCADFAIAVKATDDDVALRIVVVVVSFSW